MTQEPRTTIVTVTFNSASVIENMLDSLPKDSAIILVDNNSQDQTLEIAKNYTCTTVTLDENVGFGRACNIGAAKAKTDYLFFLNPDAQLEAETLSKLEQTLDENSQIGAANPTLKNKSGFAKLKTRSMFSPKNWPQVDISKNCKMPILSGAALFVRRKAFEDVGGFDPNIFLYHEDHELTYRLRQAGWDLYHVANAQARHIAGTGSARTNDTAWWKGYHMSRAGIYAFRKTFHRSRLLQTLAFSIMGVIMPHNLFSGRHRAKYLGQIVGAWSARKDGGVFK
ncbi:MAG: glycosyltransferase family 2 protein [Pseudomonadota bacterium]